MPPPSAAPPLPAVLPPPLAVQPPPDDGWAPAADCAGSGASGQYRCGDRGYCPACWRKWDAEAPARRLLELQRAARSRHGVAGLPGEVFWRFYDAIDTRDPTAGWDIVEEWLDAGGSVNARCDGPFDPRAVESSLHDSLLLDGPEFSITGRTLLFPAAHCEADELVRRLLRAGAQPDVQDDEGGTALMHAVSCPTVVRMLLDAGASRQLRMFTGARESAAEVNLREMRSSAADLWPSTVPLVSLLHERYVEDVLQHAHTDSLLHSRGV